MVLSPSQDKNETLGLIQNFGTCLVSDKKKFGQSRPGLVSFASKSLGLVLIWISRINKIKTNMQFFSSLKVGSHLGHIKKTLRLSVSPKILS